LPVTAGRPPKPIAQRQLEGNLGHRPLPEPVVILPAPPDQVPKPPRGLKRPGRDVWRRLWRVGGAWLSQDTNYDIMVRLCEAHNQREELKAEIARYGYVMPGKLGGMVGNPAVTQLRQLEALMTRWESECGFTPVARTRLGMAEVARVSRLDAFLSKRGEAENA
jgi:P27 family predicted phage terminase small subunit